MDTLWTKYKAGVAESTVLSAVITALVIVLVIGLLFMLLPKKWKEGLAAEWSIDTALDYTKYGGLPDLPPRVMSHTIGERRELITR